MRKASKFLPNKIGLVFFIFFLLVVCCFLAFNNKKVNSSSLNVNIDNKNVVVSTDLLLVDTVGKKISKNNLKSGTIGYSDITISSNVLEKVKYEIVLKNDISLSTINEQFVKIYVTDDNDRPINNFYAGVVPTFYDLKVSETDPGAKVIYSGVLKNKNTSKIRVRMWVADNHEIVFNPLVFSTRLDVNIK